jgi:hypothetical protein
MMRLNTAVGGLLCTLVSLLNTNAQTNSNPAKMSEVIVVGHEAEENRPGWLKEEQLVGSNEQPEWTTQRRFATTRIYVLSPWQVEFEQWWKAKWPRDGKAEHLLQSEIGVGLPYRFQLDFYENLVKPGGDGFRHDGNQVELRWAFANWDVIPLNPTLYGEWKFNAHDPDAYELKLLLGEDFFSRWHWGFNVFFEQEVGGGRGSELGFAQGLSYTVVDEIFSLGLEMKLERASGPNLDGKPSTEFLLGPSAQWRPSKRTHLDFVPLIGTTGDSPRVEAYLIFGFDFGRGESADRGYNPASSRSR